MTKEWTDQDIEAYYAGIIDSDYPLVFWERMLKMLKNCELITDIGCGPGAFTLKALEAGFGVQAVDSRLKNLQALKAKIEERHMSKKCNLFHTDWLKAEVKEADASVAAYCFTGSIATPAGLQKIVSMSRKAVFFIIPYDQEKVEFLSGPLYKKLGIAPPRFSKSWYAASVEIFAACQAKLKKATIDVLEYDFGFPLKADSPGKANDYARFLCRKIGLDAVELMREHIQKISTVRHGRLWLPNPRKSVLISCSFC